MPSADAASSPCQRRDVFTLLSQDSFQVGDFIEQAYRVAPQCLFKLVDAALRCLFSTPLGFEVAFQRTDDALELFDSGQVLQTARGVGCWSRVPPW